MATVVGLQMGLPLQTLIEARSNAMIQAVCSTGDRTVIQAPGAWERNAHADLALVPCGAVLALRAFRGAVHAERQLGTRCALQVRLPEAAERLVPISRLGVPMSCCGSQEGTERQYPPCAGIQPPGCW